MFAINDLSAIADTTRKIWQGARTREAQHIELGSLLFYVTYDQFMYQIQRIENGEGVVTIVVTANLMEVERTRMSGTRLTGFAVIDVARDRIVAETDDGEILDALGAGLVAAMVALP